MTSNRPIKDKKSIPLVSLMEKSHQFKGGGSDYGHTAKGN
jgi:hypothetical protein